MPRTKDTSASAFQKKVFRRSQKKKGLQKNVSGDFQKQKRSSEKFFRRSPEKNVFQKIFQALHKLLTTQKIVLASSRGQGLDVRGQRHQNVSSRTPPLTSMF